MFISSTFHAYLKDKNEVTTAQKATALIELAGIVGVTVLALLIIANNNGTFSLPGLNSMSTLHPILLGSAVSLLIVNLIALNIYQKFIDNKKSAVRSSLPVPVPPAPAEVTSLQNQNKDLSKTNARLQREIIIATEEQAEQKKLIINQNKTIDQLDETEKGLKKEIERLNRANQGLEAGQKQLLLMKPKTDSNPDLVRQLEAQKIALEKLQTENAGKVQLEEKNKQLENQLLLQTHQASESSKRVSANIDNLRKQLQEKNQEIDRKQKELEAIKATLEQKTGVLDDQATEKEIKSLRAEVVALTQQLEQARAADTRKEELISSYREKTLQLLSEKQQLEQEKADWAQKGESLIQKTQEETEGSSKPTATTTTTTSASMPPHPTGGPPPPQLGGLPPPPPPLPPNGGPQKRAVNGNGASKPQNTSNKGKEKQSDRPSAEALLIQGKKIIANSKVPELVGDTKIALNQMLNGKDQSSKIQRVHFAKVLEDIKSYLDRKAASADFSLNGVDSMSPLLGTLLQLPAPIRDYFISLRAFIINGSESSDRKARAKACRRYLEENIVLNSTDTSQDDGSLAAILNHAMSGMRKQIDRNDETSSSSDSDGEWD